MATIFFLADYPEHLPTVAAWIFAEWGHLTPGLTLDKVAAELRTQLRRDVIPLTMVAVEGSVPVGTASLVEHDMTSRTELSPWLASVYVPTTYRNQGIGGQLVAAVEEVARSLEVGRLYLFTPDQQHFYAHLGWSVRETTDYRGQRVVVMEKSLTLT